VAGTTLKQLEGKVCPGPNTYRGVHACVCVCSMRACMAGGRGLGLKGLGYPWYISNMAMQPLAMSI